MPERIQRRRTAGWRMPEGAVYVGRPTKWGNPFVAHDWQAAFRAVALGCRGDRAGRNEAAVKLYRLWLTAEKRDIDPAEQAAQSWFDREVMTVKAGAPPSLEDVRRELRGRDLCCWCAPGLACHADVLLEVANA